MERHKIHVKKGDTVIVISGKDKGKKGKVLSVLPKEGKVTVEGVNVVTKHQKPGRKAMQAGIIHFEAPIYSSKVMLFCEKCKKGVRVGKKILETGEKVRFCRNCGETIR